MLAASVTGIAWLGRLVRRGNAHDADERWVARIGVSERGLAQWDKLLKPGDVGAEAVALAVLLPGIQARERLALLGAPALVSVGGYAIKHLVRRARPAKHRFEPGGDESFPSTHTADAASMAFVLAIIARRHGAGWWVYGPALAFTAVLGAGRVRAAFHWPTDVAAGFLLGTAAAAGAHMAFLDD